MQFIPNPSPNPGAVWTSELSPFEKCIYQKDVHDNTNNGPNT